MALKMYAYKNCGTCRKAAKWLEEQGIEYREIPIREQPPTKTELKRMLKHMDGDLRKLFNTSGGDYKAMNMKDRLPDMTQAEAFQLLSAHGNLVKRPFVLGDGNGTVGFDPARWSGLFA